MCVCDVLHPHALRPTERESVPLLGKHPTSTSHEVSSRPQATPPHSQRGAHHVGEWSVRRGCEGWRSMVGIHHAPRAPDMVPGRARGGSRGRVRGWVGMTGGVMGRREDMLKRGQGVCVRGGWEEGPPEPHPSSSSSSSSQG